MAKSMDIRVPQDIIDNVIAAVGNDMRLLKQCTLVSSSFLLPSRKQLFSRISLRNTRTCQGIHQLLVQNPIIQSFVRSITLMEDKYLIGAETKWNQWVNNSTSLLAILRLPFCCLKSFSIIVCRDDWFWDPLDWNDFSSELKDALSNIVHSSTLKTLSLNGITKVPITFFLHIVHLTSLELHSISPYDFSDENSSSLTLAASKGVTPMAFHSVIDRCVWRYREEHAWYEISFICLFLTNLERRRHDRIAEPIFFPFMCRLRFLEIHIDVGSATTNDFEDLDVLSFLMGSLCISLTSPATLEHLEFNISFRSFSNDFDRNIFYETLRDAWSHLDSITTHPTGSRLQRVDINIFRYDVDGEEPDGDEVLKAVFDGLPSLRTKGILFVKALVG